MQYVISVGGDYGHDLDAVDTTAALDEARRLFAGYAAKHPQAAFRLHTMAEWADLLRRFPPLVSPSYLAVARSNDRRSATLAAGVPFAV